MLSKKKSRKRLILRVFFLSQSIHSSLIISNSRNSPFNKQQKNKDIVFDKMYFYMEFSHFKSFDNVSSFFIKNVLLAAFIVKTSFTLDIVAFLKMSK